MIIPAEGKALVKTDIAIALPEGCYGRVGTYNNCDTIYCHQIVHKTRHCSLEPKAHFRVEGKESLVHTVCACAKIPRNPGNSYFCPFIYP